MKLVSLILSIVAVCLGGIALGLQLKNKQTPPHTGIPAPAGPVSTSGFAVAYFDMDSLENNFQSYKDAMSRLKSKEEGWTANLANTERSYQKRIAELQQKASGGGMSQAESEAASREYQQMQQQYASKKQQMEQDMESAKRDELGKLRKQLESFLKTYNQNRKYNYIFSYVPDFMFYKDTLYNITTDMIRGLNEDSKADKAKK